jgi:hypothetical protein
MATSKILLSESRVELPETGPPVKTREFNEDYEYGAYGVLGVNYERLRNGYYAYYDLGVEGATVITELPYNKENVQHVRGLLNWQMQLVIPESYQKWVEWIFREPGNNILKDPIGTVGWKYRKKEKP